MAGAVVKKLSDQDPTPIDRQITESERTLPTLPSASERLDMTPGPSQNKTYTPPPATTDAQKKAAQAAADAARLKAQEDEYRRKHAAPTSRPMGDQ